MYEKRTSHMVFDCVIVIILIIKLAVDSLKSINDTQCHNIFDFVKTMLLVVTYNLCSPPIMLIFSDI
jgi:hypothetical protein